ncbi:MAG: hypothetical protein LC689_21200 [Myxococcales bacterium]|nr:hypothetical protein [Myxococcales bacterium]
MKPMLSAALALLVSSSALATPSTTVWAPSTTYIQPYLTPHLTYDSYFNKPSNYPMTTGLTMGILPWENVQAEIGFDLMLPAPTPFMLNAKVGVPEDKAAAWFPSFAVGAFDVMTKFDNPSTDLYNIVYAQAQHSVLGGFVSVGGYYALGNKLDGVDRAGVIAGAGSPDIVINAPWLQKVTVTADVQTGKNSFGAVAGALNFFFTDKISVLTGPVYFLDSDLQPGGNKLFWTIQLDIDMPLRAPAPVATEVKPADSASVATK